MKETEWLDKKQYRKFMRVNKFIKVDKTQFKCECFKKDSNERLDIETSDRVSNIKFVEYFKVTYSEINLKEMA